MRYNDVRDGLTVVEGVLEKYCAAMEKNKMISSDGLYADWFAVRQGTVTAARSVGLTAW